LVIRFFPDRETGRDSLLIKPMKAERPDLAILVISMHDEAIFVCKTILQARLAAPEVIGHFIAKLVTATKSLAAGN
jgi:hypothetical protein